MGFITHNGMVLSHRPPSPGVEERGPTEDTPTRWRDTLQARWTEGDERERSRIH